MGNTTRPGVRLYTIDLFAAGSPIREEERDGRKRRICRTPLLPEGVFEHDWYGLLRWTPEVFEEMRRNFAAEATGFQPSLNADHAGMRWAQNPAYGWLEELVPVAGEGLDAVWDLTDLGVEAIEKRLYRYISAEVADTWTDSLGRNFANVIFGAALTNTPFHDSMRAIEGQEEDGGDQPPMGGEFAAAGRVACFGQGVRRVWVLGAKAEKAGGRTGAGDLRAGEPASEAGGEPAGGSEEMGWLQTLAAKLGLAAEASEDQVVEALADRLPAASTEKEGGAEEPPAGPDVAGLQARIDAQAGQIEALTQRLQVAEQALETAAGEARDRDAEAAVDRFQRDGKLLPAQRDKALAWAKRDLADFQAFYQDAPRVVPLGELGIRDRGTEGGEETFLSLVQAAVAAGEDFDDASRRISTARPELYERYRDGINKRR